MDSHIDTVEDHSTWVGMRQHRPLCRNGSTASNVVFNSGSLQSVTTGLPLNPTAIDWSATQSILLYEFKQDQRDSREWIRNHIDTHPDERIVIVHDTSGQPDWVATQSSILNARGGPGALVEQLMANIDEAAEAFRSEPELAAITKA